MGFDCSFFAGPKPGKATTQNTAQIMLLPGYICLSRLPETQVLFVFRVQALKLFFRGAKDAQLAHSG